jgi:hypothetical protein
VGTPLKPNADYRLTATGLVSLTGRTRPSERRFTTPKPAPPPAPKDSAAAKPPATPPATPPAGRPVTPPTRR